MERDPRVRLKIDGKVYEMTAVLVSDPEEFRQVIGRDPVTTTLAEDGTEQVVAKWYYWQVFQRNLAQY